MTNAQLVVVMLAIVLVSVVMLVDTVLGASTGAIVEMVPERTGQARLVYAFGAVGAALGLALIAVSEERIGRRRKR